MAALSRRPRLLLVAVGLLSLLGCGPEAARIALAFSWRSAPESFDGPVYLEAAVEAAGSGGRVETLASFGPVLFEGPIDLAFDAVPNGRDRVVRIALLDSRFANGCVLFQGRSQPFEIAPGVDRTVEVLLEPSVEDRSADGPEPPDTERIVLHRRWTGDEPASDVVIGSAGAASPAARVIVFAAERIFGAPEIASGIVGPDGDFEVVLPPAETSAAARTVYVAIASDETRALSDGREDERCLQASRVRRLRLSLEGGASFRAVRLSRTDDMRAPDSSAIEPVDAETLAALTDSGAAAIEAVARPWFRAYRAGEVPDARSGHFLVSDDVRGRIIMGGGVGLGDVWSHERGNWSRIDVAERWPWRTGAAAAFDSWRRTVVVTGGRLENLKPAMRTWLLDLSGLEDPSWRTLAGGPAQRYDHAMAFHARRGVTLLFGGTGFDDNRPLDDTWTFDGVEWARADAGRRPSARFGHSMTYDAARGRVVLFGGTGGDLGVTWEWDGEWIERRPPQSPPSSGSLTWDAGRGQVILVAGTEVWAWNGTTWWRVHEGPGPSAGARPSRDAAAAYDFASRATIVFGGTSTRTPSGLTEPWTYAVDRLGWQLAATRVDPPQRDGAVAVYDAARRQVVMFGRSDVAEGSTWIRSGKAWLEAPVAPANIRKGPMAYDPLSERVVLLATLADPGTSTTTWTFDGDTWTEVATGARNPGVRIGATMVFDETRGAPLLFGGGSWSDELFLFDGHGWELLVPAGGPPSGRFAHGAAFDAARGEMLVFGGAAMGGVPAEGTWLLGADGWREATPETGSLEPLVTPGLAHDPLRRRTLLFGGLGTLEGRAQSAWSWNGVEWRRLDPAPPLPDGRWAHAMTFDDRCGCAVIFGGHIEDQDEPPSTTWELHDPPDTRPGIHVDVVLPAASLDDRDLVAVVVDATAGGSGSRLETEVTGAILERWDEHELAWVTADENAAGVESPSVLTATIAVPASALAGVEHEIALRIRTVAGDGMTPPRARVRLDALRVQLDYVLGAAATNVCGDGRILGAEVCDDGNVEDGDGCSQACEIERPYVCAGAPSDCARCGDGLMESPEACDDGNLENGDGCSDVCKEE